MNFYNEVRIPLPKDKRARNAVLSAFVYKYGTPEDFEWFYKTTNEEYAFGAPRVNQMHAVSKTWRS